MCLPLEYYKYTYGLGRRSLGYGHFLWVPDVAKEQSTAHHAMQRRVTLQGLGKVPIAVHVSIEEIKELLGRSPGESLEGMD